jgi:hypothetical protein
MTTIDIPATLATLLPASQTVATGVGAFAGGCVLLLAFLAACWIPFGVYFGLQALLGWGSRGLHSLVRAIHR